VKTGGKPAENTQTSETVGWSKGKGPIVFAGTKAGVTNPQESKRISV